MIVWVALVTGLCSGLAGSVIGTLLTVSHERAAEFRSRMLSAAEDFLKYGDMARRFARHAHGTSQEERIEALTALEIAWDDLVSASERVVLLFGPGSKAASLAQEPVTELAEFRDLLRAAVKLGSDLPDDLNRHVWAASEAMGQFGVAAMAQVHKHRR